MINPDGPDATDEGDLNELIPPDSPLYLWTACSINSRGEIIGIASTSKGETHGYMLTPTVNANR